MEDQITHGVRLDGRGIIVLGAGGGGLGSATTRLLAAHGAELLCVDASKEEASAAASESQGHAHVADITKRSEMQAVVERARGLFGPRFYGVVDIVGVARNGPLVSFDDAAIDRQLDIVLRHALLAVQLAGPILAELGRGSLVFIGSASGERAVSGQAIYGIAKAALHHLVHFAALELGPSGIRVNAVAPGLVATPRLLKALPAATWQRIAAENPLRRVATPDDVARAVLFLSSDLASYVTGNVLALDGGATKTLVLPGLDVPLGR